MSAERDDDALMGLALDAARRADFRTSPNPMVGAVVVRDAQVVATGWHERAGERHAEVRALQAAGDGAPGCDLFITLEPCTRQGRTPPCVDAVIAAAPARVVVAMLDPNPSESGNGVAALRRAGIEVSVGVREREAARLIEFYAHHITTGMPFVTAKFAASLDGHVATGSGDSKWITDAETRRIAHRLRHEHDAVLVGIGTVLADDPLLTARFESARQPLRVVLDKDARTPLDAALVSDDPGRTIIFAAHDASAEAVGALQGRGVTVERIEGTDRGVDVAEALRSLGRRGVISVLIEGGPSVLGSAFDARVVQRVAAMLSPRILGGEKAPAAVGGCGVTELSGAPLLRDVTVERCGPDIVVTGYCVPRGQ